MSTTTKTRPRKKGERKATWASFQDPCALLNASPETIREVAKADPYPGPEDCPEEQIADLNQLLSDFRVIYYAFPAHNSSAGRQREASDAGKRIAQFLRDHKGRYTEEDFDLSGLLHWITTTSFEGDSELFHRVASPLDALLANSARAKRPRVYVCDYCGRIGPAKRSDKRYCGNRCRAQASRRRLAS